MASVEADVSGLTIGGRKASDADAAAAAAAATTAGGGTESPGIKSHVTFAPGGGKITMERRVSRGSGEHGTAAESEAGLKDGEGTNGRRPFKVLLAVEGSNYSAYAFDWYIKNVHRPDYEVICYHTMEMPPKVVRGDEYCVSVEAYDALVQGSEANGGELRDEYLKKMQEHKVKGRVIVQFTEVGFGGAIVQAALKEEVQMVVVGTRCRGTLRRTLMGSVSDFVLHHTHCPVVVCCHERPRRRSSRSLSHSNSISEEVIT